MACVLNDSMLKITLAIICIFSSIRLSDPTPGKRKRTFEETFKFDYRLGIPIASDDQIRRYEKEHMMMYRKEDGTTDKGKYREWPLKLGEKNLTEYCKKYLQAVIPRRSIVNMFGEQKSVCLLYLVEGDLMKLYIEAIKCEVPSPRPISFSKSYFMTEAPETECVYTLIRCAKRCNSPFKIVFKVCGFAMNDTPFSIYSNIKPEEKRKFVIKVHRKTGIPIAPETWIKEYETRHKELHKTGDGGIAIGKYLTWPRKRNPANLTDFCSNYLETIVPNKVKDGLFGKLDELELYYTERNVIPLNISVIKCVLPALQGIRINSISYYITESAEPGCVYTLLRTTVAPVCKIVYQICGIKVH